VDHQAGVVAASAAVPAGTAGGRLRPPDAGVGAEPDLFAVERLSPAVIATHVAGGVANCAGIAVSIAFVAEHAGYLRHWWAILAGLLLGAFLADFASGTMHWAFDTFFSERSAVARMVVRVREHHVHPDRIFRYGFFEDGGLLAIFGFLFSAPFVALAVLGSSLSPPLRLAAVLVGLSLAVEVMFMGELHKIGHRRERGRVLRALQRAHLVMSPEHHLAHHAGEHLTDDCLVNGWADDTLGKLGVFRGFERAIALVAPRTIPRANDLRWQERAMMQGSSHG
jgi:hypothetical protein